MKLLTSALRLWACAFLLCAGSTAFAQGDPIADLQKQIDELKKHGGYTVNPGSLAIESWLLTSTAIEATADRIQALAGPAISDLVIQRTARLAAATKEVAARKAGDDDTNQGMANQAEAVSPAILVMTGAEPIDFTQVAMIEAEITGLQDRFDEELKPSSIRSLSVPVIPLAGALVGLFKTDTELNAIEQKVDPKLLAAAVASRFPNDAVLPSAAVAPAIKGKLIQSFKKLVTTADAARIKRDALALKLAGEKEKNPVEQGQLDRLTALLTRFDAFYARATTATNGIVPLTNAARLQDLIDGDPYILRVNTEQGGGTLLKRTNILTALGAESAFISGGLVSSYQLTDPRTGKVLAEGVITCRTTLTSLKQVQQGSWTNSARERAKANCLP